MSSQNLYVDHLAWCGLVALRMAHKDGVVSSPAQENMFFMPLARDCRKKTPVSEGTGIRYQLVAY